MSENAEMPYQPADDNQSQTGGIKSALAKAQSQLSSRTGIKGIGLTKISSGQDAIVVYAANAGALSQLPSIQY